MRPFSSAIQLLILLIAYAWLVQVGHADPAPVSSEYLRTFTGGFEYQRASQSWTMFLIVRPLKQAPAGGPLYLEASFEDPRPAHPMLVTSKSSLETEKLGMDLRSPPVTGLRGGKAYRVVIQVYGDRAHTQRLGTHSQWVIFHEVSNPEVVLRKMDAQRRALHH